ncbi:MAG: hypothetical protein JWO88_2298 [Frankiales bacterium]|nr:hypothetical protein [Frankiales bacterium]
MLRLMDVVTRALLLTGVALAVASCANGTPAPDDNYAVTWQVKPADYNNAVSEASVSRCASLPGASRGAAEPMSLPPVPQVVFSGNSSQRRRLESCLLDLKNAVIFGPSDGQSKAPVLRRQVPFHHRPYPPSGARPNIAP